MLKTTNQQQTQHKKPTILEHTIRQSNRNKRHLNKHTVLNAYKTIPLTKHSNIDKYNIKKHITQKLNTQNQNTNKH